MPDERRESAIYFNLSQLPDDKLIEEGTEGFDQISFYILYRGHGRWKRKQKQLLTNLLHSFHLISKLYAAFKDYPLSQSHIISQIDKKLYCRPACYCCYRLIQVKLKLYVCSYVLTDKEREEQ